MPTVHVDADLPARKSKPEKPDEQLYKDNLAKAEKELAVAQENLNAIRAKIDSAQPANKDSAIGKKQQELRSELQSIRDRQSGFRSSRNTTQEKIGALDAQLKSRISEDKVARSKIRFKTVEEIDREIERLEKQVDTGTMKLVNEKDALAEISKLRKERKGFVRFNEAQKGIDGVKAQISELRKSLDNPESKALSKRYDDIQQELDGIRAEQNKLYNNLNSLRDERSKLQAEQNEKYSTVREVKDQYFKARTAYRDYEQEQYRLRQEKQKAEREAFQKDKRRKIADKKLEEASTPAFMDEILAAEGLIRYFEPSSSEAVKSLRGPSGFAAEAQRSVDDTGIKGTKVLRKEDREENYFMGGGGKKGKKGKKGGNGGSSPPTTPAEGKINLSMGIIEELAKVNVDAPVSQSDIPAVVESLKQKRDQWKKDQESKTKENIARAQKEIDSLEAEAIEASGNSSPPPPSSSSGNRRTRDSAKKPAAANQAVNGNVSAEAELAQEKDAAVDVAADLQNATLEDGGESKTEA